MTLVARLLSAAALLVPLAGCIAYNESPTPAPASVVVSPPPTVATPATGTIVVQPQ